MNRQQTPQTMDQVMHPARHDPDFPDAPGGWNRQHAHDLAAREGLTLGDEHWELVRALQSYFRCHEAEAINRRELHDALEEHFHARGGLKHLYEILPGGPVAVGCRLAGLEAPAGSTDHGFGSVV